jgi:hypothetical protein
MYQWQTFCMSTVIWLLKHTNMMDERKCLEEKKERMKEDDGIQECSCLLFMFILLE